MESLNTSPRRGDIDRRAVGILIQTVRQSADAVHAARPSRPVIVLFIQTRDAFGLASVGRCNRSL